jgi:hypothetical protein
MSHCVEGHCAWYPAASEIDCDASCREARDFGYSYPPAGKATEDGLTSSTNSESRREQLAGQGLGLPVPRDQYGGQ